MRLSEFRKPTPGNPSTWGPGRFGAGREPSTDTYNPRVNGRQHLGEDGDDPCGAPISAMADGTVVHAGHNTGNPGSRSPSGSGHTIEIEHRDVEIDIPGIRTASGRLLEVGLVVTLVSRVFHCEVGSVLPFVVGAAVTAGQRVARVGGSYGYPCHPHVELRLGTRYGEAIDPGFLWGRIGDDMTVVELIQQALKDAGYDPGPVDGLVGSRTQAALTQAFTDAKRDPGTPPDLGDADVYRVTIQREGA